MPLSAVCPSPAAVSTPLPWQPRSVRSAPWAAPRCGPAASTSALPGTARPHRGLYGGKRDPPASSAQSRAPGPRRPVPPVPGMNERGPQRPPRAVQADEIPLPPCVGCVPGPASPRAGGRRLCRALPASPEGPFGARTPGSPWGTRGEGPETPEHPTHHTPSDLPCHFPVGFCSNAPKQPLKEQLLLGCFGFAAIPYSKCSFNLLFWLPWSSQRGIMLLPISWNPKLGTPTSGLHKWSVWVASWHELSLI